MCLRARPYRRMPDKERGRNLARKRDTPSLTSIPISPYGGRQHVSGKHGDLTDVLLLAPDRIELAELAPQIATPAHGLLADAARKPAHADASFFALCAARIRQFIEARAATRSAKKR
jgi:hypothetical protein